MDAAFRNEEIFFMKVKAYIAQCLGPNTNAKLKKYYIDKMAFSLEEIIRYPEFPNISKLICEALLIILLKEEPHFISNHPINLLRKSVLDFLILIPTKYLGPEHIQSVLNTLYLEFTLENEENGITILKLIRRYHDICPYFLNKNAVDFLNCLKSFYERVSSYKGDIFNEFDVKQLENEPLIEIEKYCENIYAPVYWGIGKPSNDMENMSMLLLPKSTNSFKVLAHFPLVLKVFLQKYEIKLHLCMRRYFINLLVDHILFKPEIELRNYSPALCVFMASQVKTLIFLSELLYKDTFTGQMLSYVSNLVEATMYLFYNLPGDAILLRKELSFIIEDLIRLGPAKREFVKHLHEVTKVGVILTNCAGDNFLRSFPFTTLCKILLQVRNILSLEDLEMVVSALSTKVYDEELSINHYVLLCYTLMKMLKQISELKETSAKNVENLLLHLLKIFIMKLKTYTNLLEPVSMELGSKSQSAFHKKKHKNATSLKIVKNYKANKRAFEFLLCINQYEKNLLKTSAPPLSSYDIFRCFTKCLIDAIKEVTAILHRIQYFKNSSPETYHLYGEFLTCGLKLTGLFRLECKNQKLLKQLSEEANEHLKILAELLLLLNPVMMKEVLHSNVKEILKLAKDPPITEMLKIAKHSPIKIFTDILIKDDTTQVFGTLLFNYFLDHFETSKVRPLINTASDIEILLPYFADSFSSIAANCPNIQQTQLPAFFPLIVERVLKFIPNTLMKFEYLEFLRSLFISLNASKPECILYEFVPSLSYIVQTFESWLKVSLDPQLKNILLELCLQIPVNFFTLNSHLSFLFRVTVSALNGPQHLIVMALKMLEKILFNFEWEEFQFDIFPVKDELIFSLCKTLRNHVDSVDQTAFRILGCLGVHSHIEVQKLKYKSDNEGPSLAIFFKNHESSVPLPMMKVIHVILQALLDNDSDKLYRLECWKIIKGFLVIMLNNFAIEINTVRTYKDPIRFPDDQFRFHVNQVHRSVYKKLLLSMFIAANSLKRKHMVTFVKEIVTFCTLVSVNLESISDVTLNENEKEIDPFGLIDALFDAHLYLENCFMKEKECLAFLAFEAVLQTAISAVGCNRFCDLQLLQYMTDRMCFLCYEDSSASKISGCVIIEFFLNKKGLLKWIHSNLLKILRAILYAASSVRFDVPNSRVDYSRKIFDALLLLIFNSEANEIFTHHQSETIICVQQELFTHLFHADENIRKQTMNFLEKLAEKSKRNTTEVIKSYKQLHAKIFIPVEELRDLSPNSLVALLDVLVFCMKLDPPVFEKIDEKLKKGTFAELQSICDPDRYLQSVPDYKLVQDNVKMLISALQAVSVCISVNNQDLIFKILCKALSCEIPEVHETAVQCLRNVHHLFKEELVCNFVDELIAKIEKSVPNILKSETSALNQYAQIFFKYFMPHQCERIRNCFELYFESCKKGDSTHTSAECSERIVDFINLANLILVHSKSMLHSVEKIIFTVFDLKHLWKISLGSPTCETLTNLLRKYPKEAISLLIKNICYDNKKMTSLLEILLKDENNMVFLDVIQQELISLLTGEYVKKFIHYDTSVTVRSQCLGIQLFFEISRCNKRSLLSHLNIFEHLAKVWTCKQFQKYFIDMEIMDTFCLKSYKLLVRILLSIYKKNPSRIELLFQLIQAFVTNTSVNLKFLKGFLLNVVAKYNVTWKRKAFSKFIEIFSENSYSAELKTKILELVFIPSFSVAFCKGETKDLICGSEKNNNLFARFIDKVLGSKAFNEISDKNKIIFLQLSTILTLFGRDILPKEAKGYIWILLKFASSWSFQPEYDLYPFVKFQSYILLCAIMAVTGNQYRGIVSNVFQDALKVHDEHLKPVVNSTFCILFPNLSLADIKNSTDKAIIDSIDDLSEFIHILKMFISYYKVFYPICHLFVTLILQSAQKLALAADFKKKIIAVDLVDTIIKWKVIHNTDKMSTSKTKNLNLSKEAAKQNSSTMSFDADHDTFLENDGENVSTLINILFQIIYSVNDHASTEECSSSKYCTIREELSLKSSALLAFIFSKNVFPYAYLKLKRWLQKADVEKHGLSFHYNSICIVLNLIVIILKSMKTEDAVQLFTHLQSSLASLLWHKNMMVVKTVCLLISHIFTRFPCNKSNILKFKSDEKFVFFYSKIYHFITEMFRKKKRISSFLHPRLIVLLTVCHHYPFYIDSFLVPFLNLLKSLSMKESESKAKSKNYNASARHTKKKQNTMLSLFVVNKRLGAMKWTEKEIFISWILLLAETSFEIDVLQNIIKIFTQWIKRSTPFHRHSILQCASMFVFKLFPRIKTDFENEVNLNCKFYNFIAFLLSEKPKNDYIVAFLQHVAFSGWRNKQPQVRMICSSIMRSKCKLLLKHHFKCILQYDWSESNGFWITNVIEFLFGAVEGNHIQTKNFCHLLEPFSLSEGRSANSAAKIPTVEVPKLTVFLKDMGRLFLEMKKIKTSSVLHSIAQLCYFDPSLSHDICYSLFPEIWRLLAKKQKRDFQLLSWEFVKFLSLNSFKQVDVKPNPVETFVEAVLECVPRLPISPAFYKVIMSKCNLEQRICLLLEDLCFDSGSKENLSEYEEKDAFDFLAELYSNLEEKDLLSGLWQKYAKCLDTRHGIMFEQEENFLKAKEVYENAIKKHELNKKFLIRSLLEDLCFGSKENFSEFEEKDAFDFFAELDSNLEEKDLLSELWQKYAKFLETRGHGIMIEENETYLKAMKIYENAVRKYEHNKKFLSVDCKLEYHLWKSHWEKCSRQLGDWVIDLYNPKIYEEMHSLGFFNKVWQIPYLRPIIELQIMKLEEKVYLDGLKPDFRTRTLTCSNPLSRDICQEEMVTLNDCIARWCMLPEVMTEKHKLLLKTAQYLRELEISTTVLDEFTAIQQRSCSKEVLSEDVIKKLKKAVPSRWKSYAPTVNENAVFFAKLMILQEKTYQDMCLTATEDEARSFAENQHVQTFRALAARYAYQGALKSAKFSRECGQSNLCQIFLEKLEVFAVNADIPLRQELIMQMKELLLSKASHAKQSNFIQEAFCSFCHVKYSPALEPGNSGLDTSPLELNKTSIQCEYNNYCSSNEDGMVFAEFLLKLFNEKNKGKYSETHWQEWGMFAIKFFLQSCTLGYQSESFVPISRVLWLLSYDDKECKFASVISNYGIQIPAKHWLLWIPQLLSTLFSEKPLCLAKIFTYVWEKCPQDLFFHLRAFIFELHGEFTKAGKETAGKTAKLALQACTWIFNKIKADRPRLFVSLNKIADELELLKCIHTEGIEHILKLLKKARKICYSFAFQKFRNGSKSPAPSEISDYIKTVLKLFMSEKLKEKNHSSGLKKGKETPFFNNSFNIIRSKFYSDFENYDSDWDVQVTLYKINQYISKLSKVKKRQFNLHEMSEYLCSLPYERDDLKMFAKSPLEEYETVRIARFLPQVELVQKYGAIAKKLSIEGNNGKIYQYILLFKEESEEYKKIDRISKLQAVMNCLFPNIKNTAKKFLKYLIREATIINSHTCLMHDDDSTVSIFDIFEKHCSDMGIKSSTPLDRYYELIQELNATEVQNSQDLKSIFTGIQRDFVPQKLLKDWVQHLFSCASDYWEFRKQFTHHVTLLGFIEYVFELSPQTPDLMYMQRSSGKMFFWNFHFLHNEDGGADASKNVPFRLTPNICNFITPSGVLGVFGGTFLNVAECLKTEWRKIEYVMRLQLMDEFLSLTRKRWTRSSPKKKRKFDSCASTSKKTIKSSETLKLDTFIPKVDRLVCNAYEKIECLSGSEHHIHMWKLISSAESCDNLSVLDPSIYPWL